MTKVLSKYSPGFQCEVISDLINEINFLFPIIMIKYHKTIAFTIKHLQWESTPKKGKRFQLLLRSYRQFSEFARPYFIDKTTERREFSELVAALQK